MEFNNNIFNFNYEVDEAGFITFTQDEFQEAFEEIYNKGYTNGTLNAMLNS